MVIRGGENVYPREIEEFLYGHPKIQDVQVIGVPDQKYGEEICAWIVPKPGVTLTADDVRAFCEARIARYKVPRYVKLVDAFPLTVTGKVQKYLMREQMKVELESRGSTGIPDHVVQLTRSYTHGASDTPLLGETIGEASIALSSGPLITTRWSSADSRYAGRIESFNPGSTRLPRASSRSASNAVNASGSGRRTTPSG